MLSTGRAARATGTEAGATQTARRAFG